MRRNIRIGAASGAAPKAAPHVTIRPSRRATGSRRRSRQNTAPSTPEENRAVVQGTLALFGTYTVDETKKMIVYKVESSTFPNWIGLVQERPIVSITADELIHSNAGGSIAGAKTVNIWKRAK
jgi:hypothetical protein